MAESVLVGEGVGGKPGASGASVGWPDLQPKRKRVIINIKNMLLRGALVLSRSSLLIIGGCFVGKSKCSLRNDMIILRIDVEKFKGMDNVN